MEACSPILGTLSPCACTKDASNRSRQGLARLCPSDADAFVLVNLQRYTPKSGRECCMRRTPGGIVPVEGKSSKQKSQLTGWVNYVSEPAMRNPAHRLACSTCYMPPDGGDHCHEARILGGDCPLPSKVPAIRANTVSGSTHVQYPARAIRLDC